MNSAVALLMIGTLLYFAPTCKTDSAQYPIYTFEGKCVLDVFSLLDVGESMYYDPACVRFTCLRQDDDSLAVKLEMCDVPKIENLNSSMICDIKHPGSGHYPDCCMKAKCFPRTLVQTDTETETDSGP